MTDATDPWAEFNAEADAYLQAQRDKAEADRRALVSAWLERLPVAAATSEALPPAPVADTPDSQEAAIYYAWRLIGWLRESPAWQIEENRRQCLAHLAGLEVFKGIPAAYLRLLQEEVQDALGDALQAKPR